MVSVQTAPFNPNDKTRLPEARAYLASALAYLNPQGAQMVAVGGLSGTGKTVLATLLAHQIGAAPGAVHLRSDLERKALFNVSPCTPLPNSAYRSEVSARVYEIMRSKAQEILSGGHSVIMDATWLNKDERAALPVLAKATGAKFDGMWLMADTAVLEARVAARCDDASDADVAVVRQQAALKDIPANWIRIDASGTPEDTLLNVQKHLSPQRAALRAAGAKAGETQ